MKTRHVIPTVALASLSGAIFFKFLGQTSFSLHSDEIIYVRVIQEMLHQGSLWQPTHGGMPYFHKPPFGFWLSLFPVWLLGESNLSYRLASASAGMLAVLFTYFIAFKLYRSRTTAFLSGTILLTIKPFIVEEHGCRRAVLDGVLTLFFLAAMFLTWELCDRWSKSAESKRSSTVSDKTLFLLIGILTGLSVLTKSYAGFLPMFVAVFILFMFTPKRCLSNWRYFFIAVFAAVAIPACYYLPHFIWSEGAFHKAVVREWSGRIIEGTDRSDGPWLYFKRLFLLDLVNASLVCILATSCALVRAVYAKEKACRFVLAWALLPVVLYSLIPSQLIWYIAPVFPAWSILCGDFFVACFSSLSRLIQRFSSLSVLKRMLCVSLLIFFTFIAAYGALEALSDAQAIARAITAKPASRLALDIMAEDILSTEPKAGEVIIVGSPLDTRANPKRGTFNLEAIYWRFFEPFSQQTNNVQEANTQVAMLKNGFLISDFDTSLSFLSSRPPSVYTIIPPFKHRRLPLLALGYQAKTDFKKFRPWKEEVNFGSSSFVPLYGFSEPEQHGENLEIRFLNARRGALALRGDRLRSQFGTVQFVNIGFRNPYKTTPLELDIYLNEAKVASLQLPANALGSHSFVIQPGVWEDGTNILRLVPKSTALNDKAILCNWLTIRPMIEAFSPRL